MSAGRRDQLITLQRYDAEQDDYGEEDKEWSDLGEEWAKVLFGRGDERRQAAMERGGLTAIFSVLDNTMTRDVKVQDRILFDGGEWDVFSNVPSERFKGEREIAATRTT